MKVWITSHVLGSGIFEMDAEIVNNKHAKGKRGRDYVFTTAWFKTRAEAVVDAKKQRDAKVAQLYAQIERLKAETFEGDGLLGGKAK